MKNFLAMLFLFLLGIVMYGLTIRGTYGNPRPEEFKNNLDQATKPFELSPERARFALVMSLAHDQSFGLSQALAEAAYPDVGYKDGKFYIYFAPGMSIFALPLYIFGYQYSLAQVAAFSVSSVFAVLNLLFIFKICRRIFKLPTWVSIASALIFGFGSTAWSYAITLYQHQATVFFIISSFYAVWKYGQKKRLGFLWGTLVWMNYGLAILIDYPNAVLLLPVMVYYLITAVSLEKKKERLNIRLRLSWVLTASIFVLITGLHLYYNQTNFGSWNRVSGSLIGYKTIKENNLFEAGAGAIEAYQKEHHKSAAVFFKEVNLPFGIYTLFVAPDKGIWFFTPIFILAVSGFWSIRKKLTLEHAVLVAVIVINVLLYSSWGDPWGGWAYGPRYLVPTMAISSILIAFWLAGKKFSWMRKGLAILLFSFSAAVSLLGAITTNAVPPKVEADYLKMKFGYLLNLDFLVDSRSGSFVYNHWFSHSFSLVEYFAYILIALLVIFCLTLIVLPFFDRYEH